MIWWQSLSAVEWAGPYRDSLLDHARDVLDAAGLGDTGFHLGGLPAEIFGGHPPMALLGHPYAAHRLMHDLPEYAVRAEREGFDAFVLGSYSEPHLRVTRSTVDITVASVAESSLLAACTVAERIGVVAITAQLRQIIQAIVERHGLAGRVARVAVMAPAVLEDELVAGFADPGPLVPRFEAAVAECVDAGADVVIPGEGILAELMHRAGVRTVAGASVLDPFGVALLHTVFQVTAARVTGLRPGRLWSYPRLDDDKARFVRSV